ncbi:c-type cytochrome [Azospirillum halopraeferens]|uniref:c-type cytochrome n=1 Tax=Azospirillum halopraeferens TaxID=34010 RepID=UPI0012EBF7DE|nr:c-type cytochrome [Azospirillum halopraeferens]
MISLPGLLVAMALVALPAAAAAADGEPASIARGGRLYDHWIKELGGDARRVAVRAGGTATAPGRCVTCHGWNYRGAGGAADPGTNLDHLAGADGTVVLGALADPGHGYADFMDHRDFADLAAFITRGQVATERFIDPATGRATGDATRGDVYFQTICANCHGTGGQQIEDAPPLGDLARGDPWMALHTLLNGHPGGDMPALRALHPAVVADTLARLQALPSREPLASVVRGGRLYDTWYKENRRTPPGFVHPAYPVDLPAGVLPRTTWRCKECHGWDYRGRDGAYGEDAHRTGIKGIRAMAGADPAAVVAVLGDATHAYGGLLSARDMADLAAFVTRGQVDMDAAIDRATGRARGDAAAYAAHYETICAPCHGMDGRDIRTMPPLGRLASGDPWRALHGILNGHPGEVMPPLRALSDDTVAGILAYTQTLPGRK